MPPPGRSYQNWFSNYLPFERPLIEDGITYTTPEAYFQAQKTLSIEQRRYVASLPPNLAKSHCGRRAGKIQLRPDWEDVKDGVMRKALNHKFAPGTKALERLLDTGTKEIVEWTSWNDRVWGRDIRTGLGENRLGIALMQIRARERERLRSLESQPSRSVGDPLRNARSAAPAPAAAPGTTRLSESDIFVDFETARNAGHRAAIVITTNGDRRTNGHGIMGKGIAQAARDRYPELNLERRLGETLARNGNVPAELAPGIFSFPTKHSWRDDSDLALIENSARHLARLTAGYETVFVPPPGTQNGRLNWNDVAPILERTLVPHERFVIVRQPRERTQARAAAPRAQAAPSRLEQAGPPTVFVGGSIGVRELPISAKDLLDRAMAERAAIIVGDAPGADTAVQHYLAERNYDNVTIYAMDRVRENVRGWPVKNHHAPAGVSGGAYYAVKDRAMDQAATRGIMIWDGRSSGTHNNILALLDAGKPVSVYDFRDWRITTYRTRASFDERLARGHAPSAASFSEFDSPAPASAIIEAPTLFEDVVPSRPAHTTTAIDPTQDGITHINVYSGSKTELGRGLSNFAKAPFMCEDGVFASVEGYWYWLGVSPSNPQRDELRALSGFAAKARGRELGAPDWQDSPDFQRKICAAIDAKLAVNERIREALIASDLPLRHYYVFGNGTVVEPQQGRWVIDHIAERRDWYRSLERPATALATALPDARYLAPGVEIPPGFDTEHALGPNRRSGALLYEGKAYDPAHARFFLPKSITDAFQRDVELFTGPLDERDAFACANALALGLTREEAVPFISTTRSAWEKFAGRMPPATLEHPGFDATEYQAIEDRLGRPLSDADVAEIALQARKGLEPDQVVRVLDSFDLGDGTTIDATPPVAERDAASLSAPSTPQEHAMPSPRDNNRPAFHYAGVGSRETPPAALRVATFIATHLEAAGGILRSGDARGADRAFQAGVKDPAHLEVFLGDTSWSKNDRPRPGFTKITDARRDLAMQLAAEIHPAWEKCNQDARELHARNLFQVGGPDLFLRDSKPVFGKPSEFVLCWAPVVGNSVSGGTRTAVEAARVLDIPAYNIADPRDHQFITNVVQEKMKAARLPNAEQVATQLSALLEGVRAAQTVDHVREGDHRDTVGRTIPPRAVDVVKAQATGPNPAPTKGDLTITVGDIRAADQALAAGMPVVYIGRNGYRADEAGVPHLTALGNPFKVGRDGIEGECAAKYDRYLGDKLTKRDEQIRGALNSLAKTAKEKGQLHLCCHGCTTCHAHVVAEVLGERFRQQGYNVILPHLERTRASGDRPANSQSANGRPTAPLTSTVIGEARDRLLLLNYPADSISQDYSSWTRISGQVLAADDRTAAIETGNGTFRVVEQHKLPQPLQQGDSAYLTRDGERISATIQRGTTAQEQTLTQKI